MTMQFRKSTRQKTKIRINLSGPSGAGKTASALRMGYGFVPDWDKIGLIDTERRSAELYTNHALKDGFKIGEFQVLPLDPPYTPERFIECIKAAEQAGLELLIIDSASHEWEGKGGCLELNELIANTRFKGNTWSAWSETTPRHQRFLDAITGSTLHIIGTARSKTDTILEGSKVKKVGLKDIQREGYEYEWTVSLNLDRDTHTAIASKDRTGLFDGIDPFLITEETGKLILDWCESGQDVSTQVRESISKLATCDTNDEVVLLTETLPGLIAQSALFVDAVNKRMNEIRDSHNQQIATDLESEIAGVEAPEQLSDLPAKVRTLPNPYKDNLLFAIGKKADEKNWSFNADRKMFEAKGLPPATTPVAQSSDSTQVSAPADTNTEQTKHDDAGLISVIHNATSPEHLTNIEKVYGEKINESPALLKLFADKTAQLLADPALNSSPATDPAPATNPPATQSDSSQAPESKEETKTTDQIIEEFKPQINEVTTPEALTEMLEQVNKLPNDAAKALRRTVAAKAKNSGWISNKESGKFEIDPAKAGGDSKGDQSQGAGAPPAATAPKKENAPAPAIAQSQKIEWFKERSGKAIWWQGNPAKNEYVGKYVIPEGDHIPAWLQGTIQAEGGVMFRDLTPEEAAA